MKLGAIVNKSLLKGVAPFTGAWIETISKTRWRAGLHRRPLHGGVD